jgi:hypothetical protein
MLLAVSVFQITPSCPTTFYTPKEIPQRRYEFHRKRCKAKEYIRCHKKPDIHQGVEHTSIDRTQNIGLGITMTVRPASTERYQE